MDAKAELLAELQRATQPEDVVRVIERAVAHPNVFTFGELLDTPQVQQLQGTPHAVAGTLLSLFAYGVYADYRRNPQLPSLGDAALFKLRQLTVVSMCAQRTALHYDEVMQALELPSVRALEDLLIEVFYAGLIKGSLDQRKGMILVDSAIGRDLRPGQLDEIVLRLTEWSTVIEHTLYNIESQNALAHQVATTHAQQQAAFEQELKALQSIKMKSLAEADDRRSGEFNSAEYYEEDYRRKATSASSRARQARGGAFGRG